MKKIEKLAAVCAALFFLLASAAVCQEAAASSEPVAAEENSAEQAVQPKKEKKAKKEKPAKEKKEKPSKEKPAKEPKAKPIKKAKFDQAKYDEAFAKGDYDACAGMLLDKDKKKDLIMNWLDADMLMYHSTNYQASGKGFLDTYAKMQQATSEFNASDESKSSRSSGNSIKYRGAEYERYLVWSMRLACALSLQRDDIAKGIMNDYVGTFMQEIQELRAKNAQLEAEAEKALEGDEFKSAQEKLVSSGVNFSFAPPPAKSDARYENSSFFNYLGTIAYALGGDFDHAEDFGAVYKVPQAKEIAKIPAGKGRLEVVALSGTIGRRSDVSAGKEATVTKLRLPYVNKDVPLYTKIAYPVFDPAEQDHAIKSVRVLLSNGSSARAQLIEDFDEAVKIDVARKAYGAYSLSVFRNVIKNSVLVASVIGAAIAVQQASGVSQIAAVLAQVALDASIEAAAGTVANLEHADIRQGIYFPNKASAAGFTVEPGTYNVTVEYLDGAGNVVESKAIQNVVVERGKLTARVSSCEK